MSTSPPDDEAISYYPVPAESELPPDLQKLFTKARQAVGFVPNVFRTYSYRPERLSAWFGHYRQLHVASDHLSEADREMIAVVASDPVRKNNAISPPGTTSTSSLAKVV